MQLATEIARRITVDPLVKAGQPVIKGTRIPAELIAGKVAGGMTQEEVVNEYGLTAEDVQAAVDFEAGKPQ